MGRGCHRRGGPNFGFSVDTDGDLIAVGELQAQFSDGRIYVYARNEGGPGTWGQVATQTASDGANLDSLGRSITLSGDVIAAGASNHNTDGLSDAGAAYVFGRNEGGMNNWGEITKLTASVPVFGQRFGWAIDMSGNTIVVGTFLSSGEGSAYVFENIGGTWTETAVLTASDGEAGDEFGRAVVIAGDQILVGAPGWDGTFSFVGAVYVYARNEGGAGAWGQVTRLEASDGDFGDNFGRAIGLKCDQAAISARVASNPDGVSAGAIYLFHNGADGWTETAKFGASDGVFGHDLGSSSVAIDCDLIIAGAPDDDHAGIQSGSAYLFRVPSAGAPSCAGDIDGDGIVGVPDLLTLLAAWGACQ